MVLLIDKGSASASEIVAEHSRTTSARPWLELALSARVLSKTCTRLVTSPSYASPLRTFQPTESRDQRRGYCADVEVQLSEEDILNDRDPQLEKAIEILKAKIGSTSQFAPVESDYLSVKS